MYIMLYEMICNGNDHCHYIRECIITKTLVLYTKACIVYMRRCIMKNKYYHYIREYIMTTNISLIVKMYFSLYEAMYNILFLIIQGDV